jgi:hypothetical protein
VKKLARALFGSQAVRATSASGESPRRSRLTKWLVGRAGAARVPLAECEGLEPRTLLSFGDFDRQILASGGAAFDQFGQAVAVSGDVIATGAHGADLFTGPAQTRNAANDFTTSSNPNGPWSYGWRPDNTNAFFAFDQVGVLPGSSSLGWTSAALGVNPNVWKNTTAPIYGTSPGELVFHPGVSTESVVRYTASGRGLALVQGSFGAGDFGTVDVKIVVDGVTQFSQTTATANTLFDLRLTLSAGSTIEFVVNAAGDIGGDSTPLDARVTFTPGAVQAGAVYLHNALTGQQLRKLTAGDADPEDGFGEGVAIEGNRVLVGASYDDARGLNAGAAYLFDANTGAQLFKFTASDGRTFDRFGYSVALGGNYAIIGSFLHDGAASDAGAAYVFDIRTGQQVYKFTANDAGSSDLFGRWVAISGSVALVAAPFDDTGAGVDAGSVYVFDLQTGQQTAKLTASDGGTGHGFGYRLDIEGNIALVGTYANAEAAYVFNVQTGAQLSKLQAADRQTGDRFGTSVALAGRYAFVTAQNDNNSATSIGSVYQFDLARGSSTGTQIAKFVSDLAGSALLTEGLAANGSHLFVGVTNRDLVAGTSPGAVYVRASKPNESTTDVGYLVNEVDAPDGLAEDGFGFSVASAGNWLLSGAPFDDHSQSNLVNAGSAWLVNHTTGSQIKLLPYGDQSAYDRFGVSVAVSGTFAVVGSPFDDDLGHDSGSAYVFRTTDGALVRKLTAPDGAAGDWFGHSVAISGDWVTVGAFQDDNQRGSVWLFNIQTGQERKLVAYDRAPGDVFGHSVAIDDDLVLVGAKDDDDRGSASGSAYVFRASTGALVTKLIAPDGTVGDWLGSSVAIYGDRAVVGALGRDEFGADSGAAYVFNVKTGGLQYKLRAPDGATADIFGTSVSISEDLIVVGAPDDDDRGSRSGSAYVFASATGEFLRKLTASNGDADDLFGRSVAVSGSNVVVGAYQSDRRAAFSGSVWYTGTGSLRIDPVGIAGPVSWIASSPSLVSSPRAWLNTGSSVYGIAPGELALQPGTGTEAVARYTTATAGSATISGSFGAGHFGAVTVSVLVDGVVRFTQSSASGNAVFNITQPVSVGSTIDFVVNSAGDIGGDSTPLSTSIFINGVAQPSAATAFSATNNSNQGWQFGWRFQDFGLFNPFDLTQPLPLPDDFVSGGVPILVPNTSTRIGTSAIVNEGGIARFKITRDSLLYRPLRVYFNILGEASPDDYQGGVLASGSVEIPQGQASITVEIPINADGRADVENQFQNERLTIVLDTDSRDGSQYTQDGDPTGDLVRGGQNRWVPRPGGVVGLRHDVAQDAWMATWEIADIDAKYVKIDTGSAGNASGGELSQDSVEFRLTRGGDLSQPLTVDVDLTGTALVDLDYTLEMLNGGSFVRSGTTVSITIPRDRASVVITAEPINDSLHEGIEWIHAELINRPGVYTLTTDPVRQQARVGIIDDDIPSVLLRAVQSEATEGGTTPMQVQVARGSLYASLPLTVNLALDGLGSTASPTTDYTVRLGSPTGTIVTPSPAGLYEVPLPANQSQANVYVVPVNDTVAERDEKINVRLIGGNYLPHPTLTSVELVIREDPNDQAVVSIEAVDPWAGETNRATGQFVLRRSGGVLGDALSVNVSILGSAFYGIDWASPNLNLNDPSVVTFAPGQAETVVNVVPREDNLGEDTETITLVIQQTGAYRVTTTLTSSATVFLTDFTGSGATRANWTWSMPDRYGVDRNGDGRVDVPNTQEYANPTNGFDVRFDAGESTSGFGVLSYLWTIANQAGVVQFTQTLSAFTAQLFEQIYVVSLQVTDQQMITSSRTELVEVNDILIVSAGDSVAAGEGNPVIRRFNILGTLFGSPPIPLLGGNNPLPLGWWADDGIGNTPDNPYGLAERSVEYEHAAAHRSTLAASSLTAMEIEHCDPRSSVTFVFVAQTGASIIDGILNPKVDGADNRYDNDSDEPPFPNFELADGAGDTKRFARSQLDEIKYLIGNRTIDAMTMSVGANDIGFSEILSDYVKRYHYRAGIFFTGESRALDDIRDELQRRIARLPSLYAELSAGIRSKLETNLSSASNLVIQGYFDPTGNSNGVPDDVLQDSVMGSLTGIFLTLVAGSWNPFYYITDTPLRIDAEEAAHGRQHAVIPLNREVGRASSQFGWTYVAAPTGFLTRGYSASESWIRSATDSRIYQGSEAWLKPWGAVHPNEAGQAAYSQSQLATFLGDDRPKPSFSNLVGGLIHVTEGQTAVVSVADGRTQRVGNLTYQWDLDYDGNSFSPTAGVTGSSAAFSAVGKRYPASGKIAVRVTDQLGRSSFAVVDVAIVNGTAGRTPNEVRTVDVDEPFRLTLQRTSASTDPAFSWRIVWSDGYSESVPADWLYRSRVFTTPGPYSYSVFLTDAGGEIAVDTGTVFAISNDPFPTVSVLPPAGPATEGSSSPLRFQFVRSGSTERSLSISIDFVTGGTRAINGVDFTAIDGSVVPLSIFFAVGSSTAFVDILASSDTNESEGSESIELSINPSSLYTLGLSTATGTILNQLGALEGIVFDDSNGNALRDSGEVTLAGQRIGLDVNNDGIIDVSEPMAITGADGRYTLPSLLAGTYRILLLTAAGWVTTGPDRRTAMLAAATTLSGQDFSVALPVTVTGRVFDDADIDGQQTPGEAGRSGIVVFADSNFNGAWDVNEPSALSGPDGSYILTNVIPGLRYIRAQAALGSTGTNGVDAGALAINALGGGTVAGIDHGQRQSAPMIAALVSSRTSVAADGTVTLTALGTDPWTSRVSFYRESNNIPGLQIGSGGDVIIGSDEVAGDGWSLRSRLGLSSGSYTFYAIADDGNGITGSPVASTPVTVVGNSAPTQVGIRELTTLVREGGSLAAVFEVFRVGSNASDVIISLNAITGSGFATSSDDYQAIPASITIPAGQDSVRFFVPVIEDQTSETAERLGIQIVPDLSYTVIGLGTAETIIRDSTSTPAVVSVISAGVNVENGVTVPRVALSESVSASFSQGDVRLRNLTTGQDIPAADLLVQFDDVTGMLRVAVTTASGGTGMLPAGRYQLTLVGAGLSDALSRPLDGDGNGVGGGDFVFEFDAPQFTTSWDGGGDNLSWSDPQNWTNDTLPTGADDVLIPAGHNVRITVSDGAVELRSLTLWGDMVIEDATLNLAMQSAVSGSLNLTSGRIQGAGSILITGLFTWSGGVLAVPTEVSDPLALIGSSPIARRLEAPLLINGGLTLSGGMLTIAPSGTVQITGSFSQTASGSLVVEVGADGAHGAIVAAGQVNLAGAFSFVHVDGFDPSLGFPFFAANVISGSVRIGDFDTYDISATIAGSYSVRLSDNNLSIVFNFADFNGDGGIDGSDIEAFFFAWVLGSGWADVNGDGGIDGADIEAFFALWENGGG